MENDLLKIIGFGLLLIGVCLIAKRTIRCFFQRGYTQKIIEILLALFTVIAFFFSLYSGVLSQHHKTKASGKHYYWFNPKNIFEFPIEQLQKQDSTFCDNINIASLQGKDTIKNDTVNYVFVIDKTLSNKYKGSDIKEIEAKVKSLKDTIQKKCNECYSLLEKQQMPSDILFVGLLKQLCDTQKDSCKVILYNGTVKNSVDKKNITEDTNLDSICDKYTNYCKSITQTNAEIKRNKIKQTTDFKDIIDTTLLSKKYRNVIFIFSDFYHETEDWGTLDDKINQFFRKDTSIVVKLFDLDILSNNKSDHIKECIEHTKDLFRKNGKYVTVYEYSQIEKIAQLYNNDLELFLSAYAKVSKKNPIDTLHFYYPVSFGKFNSTNTARIVLLH